MAIHLFRNKAISAGRFMPERTGISKAQPDLILLESPAEAETLLPSVSVKPPVRLTRPINPTSHKLRCCLSVCRILSGMATNKFSPWRATSLSSILPLVHSMRGSPWSQSEEQNRRRLSPPCAEILLTIWQKRPDIQNGDAVVGNSIDT